MVARRRKYIAIRLAETAAPRDLFENSCACSMIYDEVQIWYSRQHGPKKIPALHFSYK